MPSSANLRRLMTEVPRAFEVISHDDQNEVPLGRKKIGPARQREKRGGYISEILSGQKPLDDMGADVIRDYLDDFHARTRR